jgi:nucleotide-binding universal stress UspA family protein
MPSVSILDGGFTSEVSDMRILAATDFSTRSQRALRRAGLLARASDAELALVHVVDDDQPPRLVYIESREAERTLVEQVDSMTELRGVRCRPMVVPGDPFDGILRTAAEVEADLVVMGAHRKQLLRDIFVGTTVERVIRTGPYPVLMVNNEAGELYRKVLAPVDLSERSADAIRVSRTRRLVDEAHVTFLHAFLPLAKGKMFMAGVGRNRIDDYVAGERRTAIDEVTAFLPENDPGRGGWSLRVEEGEAFEVILRVVEETVPDLLVIGTQGRSGLLKVLLGSVTEEVLRSLNVDILAVPPVR